MATDDLLQKPAKQHATLFTLSWHITVVRYTDWTEDIVSGGQTFLSEPRIGIKLPAESGGVNERPATLSWPTTIPPADTLVAQSVHAQVSVLVTELIPGDDTTLFTLYNGFVNRARRGRRGDKNVASLQLNSIKGLLRSPLGIPAMRTCAWRFGDSNCQKVVVPDLQESGTIATLTDDVLTISGLTTTATANYWFRGYLDVDGERISIRRFDTPDVFYMARRPPTDWNGKSVTATPGCDKTLSTCKERWDNLEHFGALGFKMPPRHPIIELPSVPFQSVSPTVSPLTQIAGLTALYDIYEGVHSCVGPGDCTPAALPLSQLPFRQGTGPPLPSGWNSGTYLNTDPFRVGHWFDTSVVDPLLRKNLEQFASLGSRPYFIKGGVVGNDSFSSGSLSDCEGFWNFGPTDDYGGARWALRGWDTKIGLPGFCSSDFRWARAYTIGRPDPGFVSTLGNVNMIVGTLTSHKLQDLSKAHQYHDNVAGLTFMCVCRNNVIQSLFFLTRTSAINLATSHENFDSIIFNSVGSWQLTMGGAVVQNGASGSPTQFTCDGALDLIDPGGSPVGINWRVYGLRITPGGNMETFTSSEVLPFAIIDSVAAPSIMAPATGYSCVGGHLECSAMAMWDRALSDADLGTAIQYLEGRYGVFHPPI